VARWAIACRGSKFSIQAQLSSASAAFIAASQPITALDLSQQRVLIIEDDSAVRAGMKDLLQSWGAVCDAAESIDEALALVRLRVPQIVISDYRLREQRTGAQAIAAVRAELGFEVPSLLVTGDTAPQRLRDAQATGVQLLHKPVNPADLYQAIGLVLA
jgi:two-component system, sensor histidine kinase